MASDVAGMTPGPSRRRRRVPVWAVPLAAAAVLLAVFAAVEAAGVPALADPRRHLGGAAPAAAALGVGLLVVDAVLPVPSSVVSVALGARFGVVAGTALSVAGSLGAFLLAYLVGAGHGRLVERVLDDGERARGRRLLARWGFLAVAASRPVPLLAETVAVTTGSLRLPVLRALAAAAAGAVLPALAYAVAGASAAGALG